MATHSSILARRIPWTEEPAGYSLWGRKESDTSKVTEHMCMHAHYNIKKYRRKFLQERENAKAKHTEKHGHVWTGPRCPAWESVGCVYSSSVGSCQQKTSRAGGLQGVESDAEIYLEVMGRRRGQQVAWLCREHF